MSKVHKINVIDDATVIKSTHLAYWILIPCRLVRAWCGKSLKLRMRLPCRLISSKSGNADKMLLLMNAILFSCSCSSLRGNSTTSGILVSKLSSKARKSKFECAINPSASKSNESSVMCNAFNEIDSTVSDCACDNAKYESKV